MAARNDAFVKPCFELLRKKSSYPLISEGRRICQLNLLTLRLCRGILFVLRFSLRSANSVRLLWVKKIQPGFNCGAVFDGDDKSTEKICALCTEKLRVRGRLSGIEPTSKLLACFFPSGRLKPSPLSARATRLVSSTDVNEEPAVMPMCCATGRAMPRRWRGASR